MELYVKSTLNLRVDESKNLFGEVIDETIAMFYPEVNYYFYHF